MVKSERKEMLSTWDQFKEALAAFAQDLTIVGHAEEATISPFDEPKDYGQYSLVQIPENLEEDEFKRKMADIDTILITCMDKRVARPAWVAEGGGNKKIMILAIGGGVVQNQQRHNSMEIIASYLGKFNNVSQVVAADHDCICGAVKFFLNSLGLLHDQGLPGLLKVDPGDKAEKKLMESLIAYGAQPWIKAFGADKVIAKNAEVDETNHDVNMVVVDLSQAEPLNIEQLAEQLKQRQD